MACVQRNPELPYLRSFTPSGQVAVNDGKNAAASSPQLVVRRGYASSGSDWSRRLGWPPYMWKDMAKWALWFELRTMFFISFFFSRGITFRIGSEWMLKILRNGHCDVGIPLEHCSNFLCFERYVGKVSHEFMLTHVDEFTDKLLTKGYSCATALPCIQKSWVLEASGTLEPRRIALEDDFEEEEEDKDDVCLLAFLV